jgi:hypothetical protein
MRHGNVLWIVVDEEARVLVMMAFFSKETCVGKNNVTFLPTGC